MTLPTLTTPVLIVGAGPVGTVLALELARHDVACTIIERSMRPSLHPKMDYINGRSMEQLRRLGLADAVREIGVDPDQPTDFQFTLGLDQPPVQVWHQPSVNDLRARYATVHDGTAPVEPYQRVPGSLLEGLLRAKARQHPLIDLLDGWTFSDLQLTPEGVTAMVVDPMTKERRPIHARYLAACDGARSAVRRCLGIEVEASGEPTQHCSVYFSSRDPALRQHGRAFVTVGASGVTLVSRDERHAWTASVPIARGEPFTSDPMTLVQQRLGIAFTVDAVLSVAQWEGSLSVASTFRKGDAFLVGDAAHQFYPAGGYGANTGIGDAIDLGWKLAATVNGWGGPALLASYEAERRPVALLNREFCAALLEVFRRFGRLAADGVSTPVLAGLLAEQSYHIENLGAHFGYRYGSSPVIWHEPTDPPSWSWRRPAATTWPGTRAPSVRLDNGAELFDRLGPGLTLIDLSGLGIGEPLARKAEGRGVPMRYLAVDDAAVRTSWCRELVLVRPDDHVAWRGNDVPDDWDVVLDRVTGVADSDHEVP